jgi:hypothetical protein
MLQQISDRAGRFLHVLRRLYPARYSIFMGLLTPSLVPLSLFGAPGLLLGLFVLDGPLQLINITWLSLLLATLVLVTYRVTRLNMADRLADFRRDRRQLQRQVLPPSNTWHGRWLWLVLIGLPIPAACAWCTYVDPSAGWAQLANVEPHDLRVAGWCLAAIATGVGIALMMLLVLTALQRWLLAPESRIPGLFPFENHWPFRRSQESRVGWIHRPLVDARFRVRPLAGYVKVRTDNQARQAWLVPAPGHVQLLFCAVTLSLAYAAGYLLGWQWRWLPDDGSAFSALFFALLALLLPTCLLPGAAFFLDYYRIPVIVVILAVSGSMYFVFNTDHYYVLHPPPEADAVAPQPLPLGEAVDGRPFPLDKEGQRTLVVVTASGGGIQAAAWTAEVLTGLHALYGDTFARSIGLISSVSGGSVGTMYYLIHRSDLRDDYQPGQPILTDHDLEQVRRLAQASCLEATAWGVAYPDLMRVLLPMLSNRLVDRGWAVEQMWRRRMNRLQSGDVALGDLRLNDLIPAIKQNGFPMVVFNATLVETGQRLLISPVVAGRRDEIPETVAAQEFLRMFPDSRTRVSTAVRLSATFPYVSPICRALPDEPYHAEQAFHIADGGYADNDGLVTVIDWLVRLGQRYSVAGANPAPFDRVLLVQIRPFPASEATAPAENRGWLYATVGPLVTMTSVRKASQAERGNLEVKLLRQLSRLEPLETADPWKLRLESVQLVFAPAQTTTGSPASLVPLSWKLTPRQKLAVRQAWEALVRSQAAEGQHPLHVLDRYFQRR